MWYIGSSICLSVLGWGLYALGVRRQGSPRQRKTFVYGVAVSSLLLPLALGPLAADRGAAERGAAERGAAEAVVSPLAPIDLETLQHFCQCEQPRYEHRMHYRANAFLHFLFDHEAWLAWGLGLAVGGLMLYTLLQLVHLRRYIRQASPRPCMYRGQRLYLLEVPDEHPVAACHLHVPYLFWPRYLWALPEAEQAAIMAHEASHLRQRNTWEALGLRLLQCMWLLNPVFYRLRSELTLLSELLADEAGAEALGGRKPYARWLVRMADAQTRKQGMACVRVPLAEPLATNDLKARVQALCHPRSLTPRRCWSLGLSHAATLCLAAMLMMPSLRSSASYLKEYQLVYQLHPQAQDVVYCPDCASVCPACLDTPQ